jgi:light-regulated signal transduction histidine kinase (bacteriophytochrome)
MAALLAYARVSCDVRPSLPVDCQQVADELVCLPKAAISDSGGLVEVVGELPIVMGDRIQVLQLLQLFLNLVGNSLKYCRGRTPVVRLSARRLDNDWVFAVADNGIGIDAWHHNKVFEVFKRLHTQQEFPGTGIGLAFCRRIVEGHVGKIWFTSTPGEGTTFYFSLPHTPHTLRAPPIPQVTSEGPST